MLTQSSIYKEYLDLMDTDMVGINHQQCKTIFTERFRLSPSSEFTGNKIKISKFLQVNQENTK